MSKYYEEFEVGTRHATYTRTLTEGDLSFFCSFVGYHVPLFIDEEYAKKTRFGGRIIPSAMIMAISTGMTESLFRTSVVAQLGIDRGRFLLPVHIGDTITTEVEVMSKRETSNSEHGLIVFRDHVLNQRGEVVFEADKTVLILHLPS
jgi:acyl dehydratase